MTSHEYEGFKNDIFHKIGPVIHPPRNDKKVRDKSAKKMAAHVKHLSETIE